MPDEVLEYLADRFITLRVQALTGCTFEQYISDPVRYEAQAFLLNDGGGLNIFEGETRFVTLH